MNMSCACHWDNDHLPVSSGAYFNDIWGYADGSGNELAIMGGIQDVFFLDPANCTLIDSIRIMNDGTSTPNHSLWRDFKTYQQYAYAVADVGSSGLVIFDLSTIPAGVAQVYQSTAFFGKTHNIFIDEPHGRMYVAGSNTRSNGLIVLDISGSNATDPVQLASVALPGGYVHDVFVKDHIAYASHGNNGLYVYNFTDAQNPVVMGTYDQYPEEGYNHSSWVNDDNTFLVFADETFGKSVKRVSITLDIVNNVITFGDLVLFKSQLEPTGNSIAHNPFIKDGLVYISYYHDGVQVFDITQPDTVTRYAFYDTEPSNTDYSSWDGAWGVYPYLPSGTILASDQLNGFFSLQMTDQVLALEEIDFEARPDAGRVRLGWSISSRREHASFVLEHKGPDGIFRQIGSMAYDPNTDTYSFTHHLGNAVGRQHYRLRFQDVSGRDIRVQESSVDLDFPSSFRIAGNVIAQELRIQGPVFPVETQLQIYSRTGVLVKSWNWPAHTGEVSFPVSDLANGIYLIVWNNGIDRWADWFTVLH